ncbi:hypothetical protein RZS08_23145, partial [Arthrospira platensis SPKY1]|nr:hypothetical protein [Arthrospira platensis SPKY1]
LLSAMDNETATLRAGERAWVVPLTTLPDLWRGDYATLWRQPPGQRGRIVNAQGTPARDWLDERLRQLHAQGRLHASQPTAEGLLLAFQAAHGIETHGRASPMTYMMLNLVTGVEEPRLSAPQS